MRTLLLLLPFLFLGYQNLHAQAYPILRFPHELKFNAGLLLAKGAVEGSYEYYIGEDVSLGGTLYWDNDAFDYNGDFGIGPNLRAYFGYAPRSGFFAEAFGLYYRGKERVAEPAGLTTRDLAYGTFAAGLGAGNKWTTRSNRFSIEIFGGVGRNLNPEPFQDTFMFRGGLAVGFRF